MMILPRILPLLLGSLPEVDAFFGFSTGKINRDIRFSTSVDPRIVVSAVADVIGEVADESMVNTVPLSAYDMGAMTVSQLKALVKRQNPARGVLSKLKKKQDLIDYLAVDATSDSAPAPPVLHANGSVEWRTQKGASTFGLALDEIPTEDPSEIKEFPKIAATFPGALTNAELVEMVQSTLESAGYDSKNTLLATSLCCDEVNRPLESDFSDAFESNFNMGGLAGFPFGGATSFGAMAAHIPDGGSCMVVFGPHVGVDSTGAIGTVERRGRAAGGPCCGSAVAAAGYVGSVFNGETEEAPSPTDPLDAQQAYVGSMLLPYAEQLDEASDKMKELPYALYDAQSELIKRIIDQSSSAVADGTIAVLGGIQINTPQGYSDYYLPMSFDLYNNKGELMEDLMPKSITRPFPKVKTIFPGALTNAELVDTVMDSLEEHGYDKDKTLVATSLCCDEVNRPLESDLSNAFSTNFNMGGLAGFPFGGATSFGAMAAHIPDDGSCLVVYGPHVGVDSTGAVGTVERRGRSKGGSCCGSAAAAAGYVEGVYKGEVDKATCPADPLDAQQYFVGSMLLPYAKQLEEASEKMVDLPHALYDAQTELMQRIVTQSKGAVAGEGTTAVLGGIQINTPPGFTDYYLPLSFDLFNNQGELIESIWE